MKCPKCEKEMQNNSYHRARYIGCEYYCFNCRIHATNNGLYVTDDDFSDINPYTEEDNEKVAKRFRRK